VQCGVLRLIADEADAGRLKAWTVLTALDEMSGFEESTRRRPTHGRGLFARLQGPELARPPEHCRHRLRGPRPRRTRCRRRAGRVCRSPPG
jgi:hypothetical protein